MATVQFFYGFDMPFFANSGSAIGDAIRNGILYESTASVWKIHETNNGEDWFTGTGLGGAADNMPSTGSVTGWDNLTDFGTGQETFWSFSGFSVAAATCSNYVLADDVDTLLATYVMAGADIVQGSGEADYLLGFGGNDILHGNGGNDTIDGGADDDSIYGGGGDDVLLGNEGMDALWGDLNDVGDDVLDGGNFFDFAGYSSALAGVTVSLAVAGAQETGGAGLDTLVSIEGLYGSHFDDQLAGNSDGNWLTGDYGNDDIRGRAGDDILYGNEGADNLNGDAGADTIRGGDGNDLINGGVDADTLYGGDGNDTYIVDNVSDLANEESSTGGTDRVKSSVSFTLGANVENLALTGISAINGSGNSLANLIIGNGAANFLDGREGTDTLKGGGGDDSYYIDNNGDRIVESIGEGADRVYAEVSWTLGSNVENLVLLADEDHGIYAANGTGNDLPNEIDGNQGDNILNGDAGADTLTGSSGNDTYVVDNIGDQLIETSGSGGTDKVNSSVSFTLGSYLEKLALTGGGAINGKGNALANSLNGNDAANTLRGLDGDDSVSGNGGNDQLYGGLGTDKLTGGAGADRFVFDSALSGTNHDNITDFSVADDSIVLDRSVFTAFTANGTLASTAFFTGSTAHYGDDRIIYNSGNGNIYYDADGSGAGAQVLIAHVAPAVALTNADFLLVT